ncbi:MAG TPA: hypothetical protein VMR90_04535 [Candidatus Cybelea sp.]|nr:hypothetical protein [Candidatus Cybelea sp.]
MRRQAMVLLPVACLFPDTPSGSVRDAKSASSARSAPWYDPKKYNPMKLLKGGQKSANEQLDGSQGSSFKKHDDIKDASA